jgi:uncharacterized membrane protein
LSESERYNHSHSLRFMRPRPHTMVRARLSGRASHFLLLAAGLGCISAHESGRVHSHSSSGVGSHHANNHHAASSATGHDNGWSASEASRAPARAAEANWFTCTNTTVSAAVELSQSKYIGALVAASANAIIPVGLNLQKYAHRIADRRAHVSYMRLPVWWGGLLTMIFGEALNFLAYGYSPASLVAPFGAICVLVNCVIATCCLGETFRLRDGLGLLCMAGGVVLVVTQIPEVQRSLTTAVIAKYVVRQARFHAYFVATCAFVPFWLLFVLPRYRTGHPVVLLALCSVIASVTVVCSRSFASILTDRCAPCGCVVGGCGCACCCLRA